MSKLMEDAFAVKRAMYELAAIPSNPQKIGTVRRVAGLTLAEYDAAENYLLASHQITGSLGFSDDIERELTSLGLETISRDLSGRVLLSIAAERLVRGMVKASQWPGIPLPIDRFISDAGASKADIESLRDYEFVKFEGSGPSEHYSVTSQGRIALRDGFRRQTQSNPQQIGVQIGTVTNSTVQAVGQAYDSRIEQANVQGNSAELHAIISDLVQTLTNLGQAELPPGLNAQYLQSATELSNEIKKPVRDRTVILKCLSALAFMANLAGTADFADKALKFSTMALPHVLTLAQTIEKLLNIQT